MAESGLLSPAGQRARKAYEACLYLVTSALAAGTDYVLPMNMALDQLEIIANENAQLAEYLQDDLTSKIAMGMPLEDTTPSIQVEKASVFGDWEHPNWKPILRWYFSPYLTTVLTAPLFLGLSILLIYDVARLAVQTLTLALRMNWMAAGLIAWPPLLALGSVYWCLVSLPHLWARREWNVAARAGIILLVLIGVAVVETLSEWLLVLMYRLLGVG